MTMTASRFATGYWPGLDDVPTGTRARIAARIARRLFMAAVDRLAVTVHVEGESRGLGGPAMTIHRPEEFFGRLGRDQHIGFGEAYMTGAWEADDLAAFLTVLAADLPSLIPAQLQRLRALVVRRPPRRDRSSVANSRANIAHHYDLSNELFGLFLDPTLSYSAALFGPGDLPRPDRADLEAAQVRKIERLLDLAGVGDGTRLLEIGTGWGELAIRAAQRGATVRTITLSVEQKELAEERIRAAGMTDRVVVELCDYRAIAGEYDAVISVEMIEAVGWQYWPTYFEAIDRVLVPGGRFAIQAITMPHDRMLATRSTYTWVNKYIFPGGFLPSLQVLQDVPSEHASLELVDRLSMGVDYAETLRLWDHAFISRSEEVRDLGFDPTFIRMWHFYLEYSRAGFASGYLDDYQLTYAKADS